MRDIGDLENRKSKSRGGGGGGGHLHAPPESTLVDNTLHSITAYLRRMSRPMMSTLDSKNASSFTSVDDFVFIANLDEGDQELDERFLEVARQYHDRYSFALRRRKTHGVSLDCINNVNFEQFSISDLSDPLAIENLIRQCVTPLIPEFTRRNEGELAKVSQNFEHSPAMIV